MSDEIVTAHVGQFQVTSNSGASVADIEANLKTRGDKAASEAASQLGKRGAAAVAKARADREETTPEPEPEKAEPKPIKPIPDKEAKAEPAPESAEKPAEEAKAEGKDEEKPPEESKDKRGDPRHDPKARMLEATREAAEAKRALAEERRAREEERHALETRLAHLEELAKVRKPAPEPSYLDKKDVPESRPTPDGYETYEDYLDARDTYNRKQWEREGQLRYEAQAIERALDDAMRRFTEACGDIRDKVSPEVLHLRTEFALRQGEIPDGNNWIANELFASPESAPALMLHFTAHPDDLQRIAALPNPRAVSREMAKLEARLEAATSGTSTKPEDVVSKAAPPVKPVAGKPYVTESGDFRPGMSLDEFYKVRKAQDRRKR